MSKFCTNCGHQNTDDTMFCVNCGGQLAAETVQEQPAKKKVNVEGLKKNPKKLAIIGIAAAVVVIALIVVLSSLLANPWKSGLNNYFDLLEGKKGAVTKMIPKDAYDYIDKMVGWDKKDVNSEKESLAKEVSKSTKETYGDNVKYSYKVEKSKKFTKKMLEGLADGIENVYDIDSSKVKAAYIADIKVDVSGKDAFSWYETTVIVAKINGGWYVVDWNEEEGDKAKTTIAGIDRLSATKTVQEEAAKKLKDNMTQGLGTGTVSGYDDYEDLYDEYADYYSDYGY